MSEQQFNLINPDDIELYLKKFSPDDPLVEKYLIASMARLLRREAQHIERVDTLPDDAPDWLREKWHTRPDWHRFRLKQATSTPGMIAAIADWISYAISCEADWLRNVNGQGIPQKLLSFGSLVDAYGEIAEDKRRLHAEIRKRARHELATDAAEDILAIIDFEDGHRLVRLMSERALDRESAFLEHCIGDGGYDSYLDSNLAFYSLRDEKNNPCMTFSVDRDEQRFDQVSGKRNQFPKEYIFYLSVFADEFSLSADLVRVMAGRAGNFTFADRSEFGFYFSVSGKAMPSPEPQSYFESDAGVVEIAHNTSLESLTINDIGQLAAWPDNLHVKYDAVFYGGTFPSRPPVGLQVGGSITTRNDVFDSVDAFVAKIYGIKPLSRPLFPSIFQNLGNGASSG